MVRLKMACLIPAACGVLALSACETVTEEVNEVVGNNFHATLTGASEVPPADADGAGMARIAINDATNQVCTDLEVRNINAVTAAHIHEGRAGVNGPPVITLDAPDDDDSDDCDTVSDALVDRLRRNPSAFYVNVHTADYPNGAIRGQIVENMD
ncbi:MAG TPA: CHRD domain-containing protein [Allosphingosinicella sp.]|nr:CHRD domain-containing protein [Allosphingosinicella sp.]